MLNGMSLRRHRLLFGKPANSAHFTGIKKGTRVTRQGLSRRQRALRHHSHVNRFKEL